jgi:hypothetical protein
MTSECIGDENLHKQRYCIDSLLSDEWEALCSMSFVRFVNRYLENLFGFVRNDSKDLRQAFQIHIDIFNGINDENKIQQSCMKI